MARISGPFIYSGFFSAFSCYARVRSSAAAGHDRAIENDLIDILGQSVFTSLRLDLCGVLTSVGSSKTSALPKKRTSIPLVSFTRISAMLLDLPRSLTGNLARFVLFMIRVLLTPPNAPRAQDSPSLRSLGQFLLGVTPTNQRDKCIHFGLALPTMVSDTARYNLGCYNCLLAYA